MSKDMLRRNTSLQRISKIIEEGLEYDAARMIHKSQRKQANILWIYDVLHANLGAIKHIKF